MALALVSPTAVTQALEIPDLDEKPAASAPNPDTKTVTSTVEAVKDTTAKQLNYDLKSPKAEKTKSFATANSGVSFNPSATQLGASAYVQENNYRIEGSISAAINGSHDNSIKASFAMLHEAALFGTHIEVEVGSNIHRLAMAESAIVSGGIVKVSVGLLNAVEKTVFSEYSAQVFDVSMQQKSVGIDFTKSFDNPIMKELKTSVVYFDVDNNRIGKIKDLVVNDASTYNWSEIIGGVAGGTKVQADLTATLKLGDSAKLDISGGAEQVRYNEFLGTAASTKTGGVAGLNLTIQPDNKNKINF